jgi:Gene product 88
VGKGVYQQILQSEDRGVKHTASLRRHGSVDPGRGVTIGPLNPAFRGGRSIFPSRIFAPDEVARLLKSGHQSRKIGKEVRKGSRYGWPIFTLTLEERASCPRSCDEWASCYGNNMQAAERIEHGPELIAGLEVELAALQRAHPAGFMVRLHVLGDFYSAEYVSFWARMLAALPALHLFGFTARAPASEIGRLVDRMTLEAGWARCAIRFSGSLSKARASRVIGPGESDAGAILCPAQTGATETCGTCALCWHSERSIAFQRH